MSDCQHTPVVPLYLMVSRTKYSITLLLSLSFLSILFGWSESHDKLSEILKYTALPRLGHEISYHFICGAPLSIHFLLTDTVSDEKETNVYVLVALATCSLPINLQDNGALVVLVKQCFP